MTEEWELVKSKVVKRFPYAEFQRLCLVIVLVYSVAPKQAGADLLVRYPVGMEPSHLANFVESLRSSLEIGVLSVAKQPTVAATAPPPSPATVDRLHAAEAAYKRLDLEKAVTSASDLDTACLRETTFGSCQSLMFDSALLRGMAFFALGRTAEADASFQTAHTLFPGKVLDPKRYSPNILRAFAAACADAESASKVDFRLIGEPPDAVFFLDGEAVRETTVRLSLGRHIVEAHLPGFDKAVRIINVDEDSVPGEVVLRPTPQSDVAAWTALTAALSSPDWTPTDPGIPYLLRRFRIDAVLLLDFETDGTALEVRLAREGRRDLQSLPGIDSLLVTPNAAFNRSLKEALGLAEQQPPVAAPLAVPEGPMYTDAEDDDDLDEDEEEEEDSSIQFDTSDEPVAQPDGSKNILKSPWLWISVGVVAAIVTGVVVSVQVQD